VPNASCEVISTATHNGQKILHIRQKCQNDPQTFEEHLLLQQGDKKHGLLFAIKLSKSAWMSDCRGINQEKQQRMTRYSYTKSR
jgi:hypothetical protein